MAFPQSVLPVRVKIAPGGRPGGDPAGWVWQDITDDVRVDAGVVIEEGRADEGARVDPSKCTLKLNNRDGHYSTRNVLGRWYGLLDKNTPLRVSTVAVTDTFTRTTSSNWGTADTGQLWSISAPIADFSTSGSAALIAWPTANAVKIATLPPKLLDIDATWTVSVPVVMTGASMVVGLYARHVDPQNTYVLSVEFDPGGTLTAQIRVRLNNSFTTLAAIQPVPGLTYTPGQKIRARAQVDGSDLRLKLWPDGAGEPDAWTVTTTDTSLLGAGKVGFYQWLVNSNTNTKPFSTQIDDFEVEAVEFTGTVPEWPPRWDLSRRDATVPITAAGILRRLQQGKSPLRSPIVRALLRNAPVALWPMDDDSDSTRASTALSGVVPAAARAVEFGQESPQLYGAKQTAGVTASTVMSGRIPAHAVVGGAWSFVWFAQLLAPPAATTTIMYLTSSGTVRYWNVDLDAGGINVIGRDVDGIQIFSTGASYGSLATPPRWMAFHLLVKQNGGNVDWRLEVFGAGADPDTPVMFVYSGSTAGSIGRQLTWAMQGSLGFNGGRLGPVASFGYAYPFISYAFAAAANGYIGETASARIGRLCAEENVRVVIEAGTCERLGPQRTDTFLNLLYAAEAADLGILYERSAGLGYRPRGGRYNRLVDLPLDFAVGDIAEPPEPMDDDQQLRNQWTVSRDSGSSATITDTDSVERVGLLDESATVNVYTDDVLESHAAFRVKLGTVDEYRWPRIALNLARNTGQIALWRAAAPFPRMTIANEPDQVAGNDVDVTVLGTTQTLTPYGWDVELNCVPSSPWVVVTLDGTWRADTAGATLSTAVTASATTLVLASSGKNTFSTDSADYPADIWLGGEQVTLTAPPAGAASPQTFTGVTRSVNGISKPQGVGATARAWRTPYPAL